LRGEKCADGYLYFVCGENRVLMKIPVRASEIKAAIEEARNLYLIKDRKHKTKGE
jgi:hypothetical protein